MATALPESKSLQERINALHIQLTTANEEQQKGLLKLIDEDDVIRLSGSKCRDRQGWSILMGEFFFFFFAIFLKNNKPSQLQGHVQTHELRLGFFHNGFFIRFKFCKMFASFSLAVLVSRVLYD